MPKTAHNSAPGTTAAAATAAEAEEVGHNSFEPKMSYCKRSCCGSPAEKAQRAHRIEMKSRIRCNTTFDDDGGGGDYDM